MPKKIGCLFLAMLVLLLFLPALVVKSCAGKQQPPRREEELTVSLWKHSTEQLIQLPMEEYLAGVVAAEMPVSFHIEALKAQAIVARTYALAKVRSRGGSGCDRHPEADICTDSTHCQAWVSKEEAVARWSFFRQRSNWRKILQAVSETRNQVIVYEGRLIDAVYHSTCGGSTENSEDVWTNRVSYLRSVECGYCYSSPRYTETTRLSAEQVAEKLGVALDGLRLAVLKRSESGRIVEIDIGTEVIRGLEFRGRLGLRSSKVTWLQEGSDFSFTCVGYGHGVGLCQYGADGMARQGYNCADIITKYFSGVKIEQAVDGE